MTGYQSKKAAAQDKLTVDREQLEHWLQSLKDIDALHHSQEPESVDAQKAIADMGQVLAQPAQEPVAWPCEIEEADFEQDTITLKMLTSEYVVRAGKHWLSTTPPAAQPADPTGQAPCVRHCESTAYEIVIRGLKGDIERLEAAQRPWVGSGDLEDSNAYQTPPAQTEQELEKQLRDALGSLDFYRRRVKVLQQWQSKMRDPERTIVCDILANGHTLEPAGDRYTPPAAQSAQRKPVDLTNDEINNIANGCHLGKSVQDAIREALAKFKEKNNG